MVQMVTGKEYVMVTKEEMQSHDFKIQLSDLTKQNGKYQVSAAEMLHFSEDYDELALDLSDMIEEYVEAHRLKPKYEKLEELTHLSVTTIKHSISGQDRITRTTLYKFTVGLGLSLDKANELFEKCGGVLKEDCLEDYVCIRALEDGDDVAQFIKDYNQYTQGARLKDHLA